MMYEPEDRVALWHTKGPNACGGRAMWIKPYVLDTRSWFRAEDTDEDVNAGDRIVCGNCGVMIPKIASLALSVKRRKRAGNGEEAG